MGEVWIPEAQDLTAAGTSGTMDGGTPRVTWHVTVSPSGGSYFDAMHGVLTRNKSEPHILYDPLTDRLGQYFPLNRSARALANDGTRRTNGHGSVNIQIEVVAQPDGFTRYWKPGPNYRALMRAIRSWGVPDVWPAGRVSKSYADKVTRTWTAYSKAGHFGHCHVPGNDHWDPGPIDQAALLKVGATLSEEDELMAITVKDPTTGTAQPIETVLLSIWIHAIRASRDAGAALAIAKAQAAAAAPLTEAQIAAAAKAGAAAAIDEEITSATVTLSTVQES
jgi:hypothetical protein